MKAQTRRRVSYVEAGFWASQTPLVFLLPQPTLIKYLSVISIYAIVRTCITGAQADTPDD